LRQWSQVARATSAVSARKTESWVRASGVMGAAPLETEEQKDAKSAKGWRESRREADSMNEDRRAWSVGREPEFRQDLRD
jgi:hypothetical protein